MSALERYNSVHSR